MKKTTMRSKIRFSTVAPIRLTGNEEVEVELQSFPPVRVRIRLREFKGRGKLIEITGIDCPLQIQPAGSAIILIDSDGIKG